MNKREKRIREKNKKINKKQGYEEKQFYINTNIPELAQGIKRDDDWFVSQPYHPEHNLYIDRGWQVNMDIEKACAEREYREFMKNYYERQQREQYQMKFRMYLEKYGYKFTKWLWEARRKIAERKYHPDKLKSMIQECKTDEELHQLISAW